MHAVRDPEGPNQLISIFHAALEAVRADRLFDRTGGLLEVRRASRNTDQIAVIGAGKAAIPMARCVEDALDGAVDAGLIVVPEGYAKSPPSGIVAPDSIEIVESGHPIPTQEGAVAGRRMLDLVRHYGSDDLVIVLISGGASALLSTTMPGITVEDLSQTTAMLLRSGASVHDVNVVRKHLTAVGGGRLAHTAFPAPIFCYIVSDVIGDDPSDIGSGPCVPDESTFRDARDILNRLDMWTTIPESVANHLRSGGIGSATETPDSDSDAFEFVKTRILGSNGNALEGARLAAERSGVSNVVVQSELSGEAREIGTLAARKIAESEPGTCLIWGGETTVTVRGDGVGGRNHELILAAALELERQGTDALILSAGTDGVDGMTDAAGAWTDNHTIARARSAGLNPEAALENNDSGTFFEALDQQVVTGPTHTNVMDVVIAKR